MAVPCEVSSFPTKYLGRPLSLKKLTKADLLPLIDKIAYYLPGWKASLITKAGHSILVRAVFTGVPIYHLIALDIPKWAIKLIDKICQGVMPPGSRWPWYP